jgi:hypothetical protein
VVLAFFGAEGWSESFSFSLSLDSSFDFPFLGQSLT